MDLGKRIKAYRILMHMTQQELAEKIYTTSKTISDYERNISEPNINTLKDLAKVLNVTISDLLDDNENTSIFENDFLFALYGETKDLTEAQKQDVLDFVKKAVSLMK